MEGALAQLLLSEGLKPDAPAPGARPLLKMKGRDYENHPILFGRRDGSWAWRLCDLAGLSRAGRAES